MLSSLLCSAGIAAEPPTGDRPIYWQDFSSAKEENYDLGHGSVVKDGKLICSQGGFELFFTPEMPVKVSFKVRELETFRGADHHWGFHLNGGDGYTCHVYTRGTGHGVISALTRNKGKVGTETGGKRAVVSRGEKSPWSTVDVYIGRKSFGVSINDENCIVQDVSLLPLKKVTFYGYRIKFEIDDVKVTGLKEKQIKLIEKPVFSASFDATLDATDADGKTISPATPMTGYRRAKDVMDEVIAGTKEFTRKEAKSKGPNHLVGDREMYNMNRFWALAYQETLDPEIAEFARASREVTVNREWKSKEKRFNGPVVYLYDGLVMQQRVFKDAALGKVMLEHLEHEMHPIETIGGIRSPTDTIGCQWAYEQTKDIRFANAAWDVARGMADLVPDVDLATEKVPTYPYTHLGNSILRLHFLPILVGASLGDKLGFDTRRSRKLRNNFFTLSQPAKKGDSYTGTAFILATEDGPLEISALLRTSATTAVVSLTRPKESRLRRLSCRAFMECFG